MAIHSSLTAMVREALPEYVEIAKYAITTQKPERGFYGYPAAALLLAVADAIGSYYEGNHSFKIPVDGKERFIDGDGARHFLVLNSVLYGESLTGDQIRAVHDHYRNPLLHNASMVPGVVINAGAVDDPVFYPHWENERRIECINLRGFLRITDAAVKRFLLIADAVIPGSRAETLTLLKG